MSASSNDRLRVLLIAEACNPGWTSVPLIGYNLARALAERSDLDITLVSHVRNREALSSDPIASKLRLCLIDNEWAARPLFWFGKLLRRGSTLSWTTNAAVAWPSYILFEKLVESSLHRELADRRFDVIHRITPVSPIMGSPLASCGHAPMIIGPINGGLPWPKEFLSLRAQEREWLAPLRGCYRCLPHFRSTYQHLAAVICGSRFTMSEIPRHFHGRKLYLPENAVSTEKFPLTRDWTPGRSRFRFISVGRLVPLKGVDLILEALARPTPMQSSELVIVGDGPHRAELEKMTQWFGIQDRVRFAGWLPQSELAGELANAQAFVFPSLKEFGGGAALEAMAMGLPSVVVNYGGPGELLNDLCGIRLPMQARERLVPSLRAAMEKLSSNEQLCREMSRAAQARVRDEFTWDVKTERINELYREVVSDRRSTKGLT